MKCAAFELPFTDGERFGKEDLGEILRFLEDENAAAPLGGALALDERELPGRRGLAAQRLLRQLRGAGHHPRAAHHRRGRLRLRPHHGPREGHLHPGGQDATSWRSTTTRSAGSTCARPRSTTTPTPSPTPRSRSSTSSRRRRGPGARRSHGEVHVTSQVVGFKKIKFYTNENVGSGELHDARERDAHHLLLAHGPARADARAPLRPARSGATGWWRCPTPWASWPRCS